jgi:hypothetical protein
MLFPIAAAGALGEAQHQKSNKLHAWKNLDYLSVNRLYSAKNCIFKCLFKCNGPPEKRNNISTTFYGM